MPSHLAWRVVFDFYHRTHAETATALAAEIDRLLAEHRRHVWAAAADFVAAHTVVHETTRGLVLDRRDPFDTRAAEVWREGILAEAARRETPGTVNQVRAAHGFEPIETGWGEVRDLVDQLREATGLPPYPPERPETTPAAPPDGPR